MIKVIGFEAKNEDLLSNFSETRSVSVQNDGTIKVNLIDHTEIQCYVEGGYYKRIGDDGSVITLDYTHKNRKKFFGFNIQDWAKENRKVSLDKSKFPVELPIEDFLRAENSILEEKTINNQHRLSFSYLEDPFGFDKMLQKAKSEEEKNLVILLKMSAENLYISARKDNLV